MVLSAAQALHHSARAVVERLATVLRKKAEILGHERPSELVLFQALSGSLPVLRDMVQDGKVHPRRAYQEMARLVGTLYFRSRPDQTLEDIPFYDHQAPGPVFERLRLLIEELSEIEIRRRYDKIPMERTGDIFRAGLSSDQRKPGVRLLIEVTAAESSPRVRPIMQSAKISTPARIETLKQFALPGISNEPQPGAPPELPTGQAGAFFRLKHEEGTEWSNYVVSGGALAAFLMNAPQDVKLTLVIIFPGG
jgi:type VI secretion system protein ImpJ